MVFHVLAGYREAVVFDNLVARSSLVAGLLPSKKKKKNPALLYQDALLNDSRQLFFSCVLWIQVSSVWCGILVV